MTLADKLFSCFKNKAEFTLEDAYQENSDKPKETVRARIYDNLGIRFERIAKGVYKTIASDEEACIVIEGDGRDLSMIKSGSIDCILTDHPWLDIKSNKGGSRAFAVYDCFLVEILPAENENNYEYLYQIKQYAKEAGFLYYSKVTWEKRNLC